MVLFTKKGTLVVEMKEVWRGWIGFTGLSLLAVVSLPPIRKASYTLFWHAHWIGYLMLILGVRRLPNTRRSDLILNAGLGSILGFFPR